ncbi:MAG TPA: hypothetical protein VLU47_07945, partial [Blastocatellia bacterium]|nr:hypothetical protein [Blastocatellia bacterium]
MPKELIISANVHEKKVAIIEDGLVTEFYVERRDENQGVVGNLYKGRVMKVLPGMQSAFVDIGLDRDAFLYVSDFTEFLEEEDEIDFRPGEEVQSVERPDRLDDRGRRDPRRRPEPVPPAGRPAPGRPRAGDAEPVERALRLEDAVEQLAEIATEKLIPPPPADEPGEPRPEGFDAQAQPFEDSSVERVTDEPLEALGARVDEMPADEIEAPEDVDEKPRRGRARKKPADAETVQASTRSRTRTPKVEEKGAPRAGRPASKRAQAKPGARRAIRSEIESPESDSGSFERVTD